MASKAGYVKYTDVQVTEHGVKCDNCRGGVSLVF